MVFYGTTAYAMDSLAKRRKLKRNHVLDFPSSAESTDIQFKASPTPSQQHPIYRHFYLSMLRRHWMLYSLNVFINCASTTSIAFLPLYFESPMDDATYSRVAGFLIFSCIMFGLTVGGSYILYPLLLVDILGHSLWPAGLGIFLATSGVMSIVGTLLGGKLLFSHINFVYTKRNWVSMNLLR
ncbi:unnamed protein product [Protopolystoma xenopodis]|uniref:Uncharacterized protein n=1 Tax=Protopolystoma xenopodis TaxID=117903 RepID=A0A448XLE7_9PLAT|nr:unnamed protein product [Protopolystoma xenopodis]